MRLTPLLVLLLVACEPVGLDEEDTVELTLRMDLRGGKDLGSTPAGVFVFTDSQPVRRGFAIPQRGERCVFSPTPVTVCTLTVPRRRPVTLMAYEPDPAVVVRLAPASPDDTLRDGRYVEFTEWNDCPDAAERGVCVVRPSSNVTITATFQLLQQVTFNQTGVARMDYRLFSAAPTLKVPAQNDNIIDLVGCRQLPFTQCDSLRMIGDTPHHRITAYVPRKTIVAMFSQPGMATEIVGWDGPCIQSSQYGPGVCSLISPDTSGAPIFITVNYTWWDCPSGISDRQSGFCGLRGFDEAAIRR
jgi:hypothetical protein